MLDSWGPARLRPGGPKEAGCLASWFPWWAGRGGEPPQSQAREGRPPARTRCSLPHPRGPRLAGADPGSPPPPHRALCPRSPPGAPAAPSPAHSECAAAPPAPPAASPARKRPGPRESGRGRGEGASLGAGPTGDRGRRSPQGTLPARPLLHGRSASSTPRGVRASRRAAWRRRGLVGAWRTGCGPGEPTGGTWHLRSCL